MRFDKLTTKFQQALADAQSPAVANDNHVIDPLHLLAALLAQEDDGTSTLLPGGRRGTAPAGGAEGRDRPAAEGRGHRRRDHRSRDLNNLLNLTDKEATKRGDQFIASELFLLAAADDKGEAGRLLREAGRIARRSSPRSRRCAAASASQPGGRRPARGVEEVHDRPDRARAPGQARPGDRPRPGNPPRDPGPVARAPRTIRC